jgi:enoyl reductase
VIGTASPRNHDYLRSLGAEPVSYGEGLADRIRQLAPGGVDAALDAVGGDAAEVSTALIADRQRIGTLSDQAATAFGLQRLRGARSAQILAALARLCADGDLQLSIAASYPLTDAAGAHREVETGHVRGKVVLTVD